ncbi:Plant organelle RNA recognition domain [Dillenia turbinata]|uniref:Plant organelle RNA recognition domain n=1 Tax=Dillenia turbinata TaxID=194707 RepID=A0AAN8ZKZ8_9MAGN
MFRSSTNVALGIICILLSAMTYCLNADLAEDKKECGNQLASLSPCLDFVEGNSKAPSKQCCVDLGKMITTTKKCLCVLVKDRNDANLSFKVNATLALSLPFICHAPANISECPDLLHLPPNSTDAQVFLQFSSPSVPSVSSNAPMEASSATPVATRIVRRLLVKRHQQIRSITKVRLKWVKNRSLDYIIDKETDLKAVCLLKDSVKRSSTNFITSQSLTTSQKLLGLTVPPLRFIRRYPTLFQEFPHPKYASLPCFKLTDTALLLDSQEQKIYKECESDMIENVIRVLMMMKSRQIPFQSLYPLKWDLGLPDDFDKTLIRDHSDKFRVGKTANGLSCLSLVKWHDEFAVSALERAKEKDELSKGHREFKRGRPALAFPMSFPKGYGGQKKVKAWMDEFQKLPYISPYEDSRGIDPNSELMEKRVVGVLHEFLSLTIHKKTKRNYLRALREELNLPHKFTRLFTRYPGIFYLSLKCKTTTVALREGYQRGKLVDPHPLAKLRDKYYYVMRTGVLYRCKGVNLLPEQGALADDVEDDKEEGSEDEEFGTSDEYYEEEGSEMESGSDDK